MSAFSTLSTSPFSGRLQARMGPQMREALLRHLNLALLRARADGTFPYRTGRSYDRTYARAFGTSFSSLRGSIIGPGNIAIRERGGEIHPQEGEFLAVPIFEALRPDGTPKLPGPRSWANIKKTFVYPSKKTGQKYIAYKDDGGEIHCIYVLLEMATVKGKHFMEHAVDHETPAMAREFGNIMLAEVSKIDLMKLARITTKGRKPKPDGDL
jgi:hypothetical protein